MEKLTKHQIIDETVEYYNNNPRSKDDRGCAYLSKDGLMCGHSRCLTEKARTHIIDENDNGSSADDIIRKFGGDDIHLEQYRGHSVSFWLDIQTLHDTDAYWIAIKNGNLLTHEGLETVKDMKLGWVE